MKEFLENKYVWYVIFGIIALFIIKSILTKIGLVKNETDINRDIIKSNPKPFLIGSLKEPPFKHVLKTNVAITDIAKNISDAMIGTDSTLKNVASLGIYGKTKDLGTDETKFFNALYQIKSKSQFNQLAKKVSELFGYDLHTQIIADLDNTEYDRFYNYVNALPEYLIPK